MVKAKKKNQKSQKETKSHLISMNLDNFFTERRGLVLLTVFILENRTEPNQNAIFH
jgi:hypothetical protein